jgi:hypothetical protein
MGDQWRRPARILPQHCVKESAGIMAGKFIPDTGRKDALVSPPGRASIKKQTRLHFFYKDITF